MTYVRLARFRLGINSPKGAARGGPAQEGEPMLDRLKHTGCAALAAVAATTVLAASPAGATAIGIEGCTPGYWKNHTENWLETATRAIPTSTLVTSVYPGATIRSNLAGVTLLQALQGGWGSGVAGAAVVLARAASAANLNAAHEGLGYPWRRNATGVDGRPALVPTVNAAFRSGDRATMLALASRLDADNNLGCPLS
jgi:hypothetical protein